jgi:hypothetical protein
VTDIDLRLRGGGPARDALNPPVDRSTSRSPRARPDPLAGWLARTRLLGGGDGGVPFNCIAGRLT